MNRGGNTSPAAGFTIVETLIVLAVTSALFMSTALLISGRQARTNFQLGTQAAARDMQSLISQIESGRYTNQKNFTCYTVSGEPRFVDPATGSMGSDGACIFLGQALVFGPQTETYKSYLVAGARVGTSGADNNTINEARPRTTAGSVIVHAFPNGLTYAGSRYVTLGGVSTTVPASTTTVVRLLSGLDGADTLTGDLAGSQKVKIHTTTATDTTSDVNRVNTATPASQQMKSFEICLSNPSTNQSVIIGMGTALSNKVSSNVRGGVTCW